jgi:hypothetical protein
MFDAMLSQLETDLHAALGTCVTGLVAMVRGRLEDAHADLAKERTQLLVEVAEERVKALAEVYARRAELGLEVAAMQKHKEAQEGRVKLNVGGYRFETSVQTLRRMPHTFFDAYFSGRYAQDVCSDGSIFIDRDGEHFGHVLEYMRDGVVSVAEAGTSPSVSLLRALKREFGFYCIELCVEDPAEPARPEMAFVMGGTINDNDREALSTIERYDILLNQWSAVTAMRSRRKNFGTCAVMGEVYVTGGEDEDDNPLSSIKKYSPVNDTWSTVSFLPELRSDHAQDAVGSAMYVLGGFAEADADFTLTASVLKFDSVQGIWSAVAPMPAPRYNVAACVVGSYIYVFGGMNNNGDRQRSDVRYNVETDKWSMLAPMPSVAYGHSAVELGGLIYLVGSGVPASRLMRYDPVSGFWNTLGPLIHTCRYDASFVLGGCLYAAGGEDSESNVQRYDAATDIWTAVSNMLEGRAYFGAVTIGSKITPLTVTS